MAGDPYILQRALEVISSLNETTTSVEYAREIAKRGLHNYKKSKKQDVKNFQDFCKKRIAELDEEIRIF